MYVGNADLRAVVDSVHSRARWWKRQTPTVRGFSRGGSKAVAASALPFTLRTPATGTPGAPCQSTKICRLHLTVFNSSNGSERPFLEDLCVIWSRKESCQWFAGGVLSTPWPGFRVHLLCSGYLLCGRRLFLHVNIVLVGRLATFSHRVGAAVQLISVHTSLCAPSGVACSSHSTNSIE